MGRLIGTTQYPFLPAYNFQNTYTYDVASNRLSLTAPLRLRQTQPAVR